MRSRIRDSPDQGYGHAQPLGSSRETGPICLHVHMYVCSVRAHQPLATTHHITDFVSGVTACDKNKSRRSRGPVFGEARNETTSRLHVEIQQIDK